MRGRQQRGPSAGSWLPHILFSRTQGGVPLNHTRVSAIRVAVVEVSELRRSCGRRRVLDRLDLAIAAIVLADRVLTLRDGRIAFDERLPDTRRGWPATSGTVRGPALPGRFV